VAPPVVPPADEPESVPEQEIRDPTYLTFGAGQESPAPAETPTTEPEPTPVKDSPSTAMPTADPTYVTFGDTPRPVAPAEAAVASDLAEAVEPVAEPQPIEEPEAGPEPEPEPEAQAEPEADVEAEPEPEPEAEAEREPEPAPTTLPTQAPGPAVSARRRVPVSARAAGLAAVAVLAAAAIGFVIAPSSNKSGSTAPPLASTASSGPIAISFPAAWQSGNTAVTTPGLKLANQIALTPTMPSGGALVIGTARTTAPTLLPATLVRGGAPTQQVVTLGHSQFYRYANLTPPGASAPEVVYALPTTAGTVLGVCMLQGASAGFPVDCEHVISTLRLTSGAKVIGLGPSAGFASALGAVIHDLNPAVQRGQVALGRARKPGDQARAANQVADAYARSASALKHLPPNPPAVSATAALAGAFQAEQRAYAALARTATHNDRKGYNAARGSITSAGSKVSAALAQLSHLGYVSS
jgi:hypothetical protein